MIRRISVVAAALLLAGAAVLAITRAASTGRVDAAHQVAEQLNCPDCQGQSVADSTSPVAMSMRQSIDERLASGQSPAEVRDWFVARYGPDVVRESGDEAHVLLWLIPAVVILAVGVTAVYTVRRRRADTPDDTESPPLHRKVVFLSVSGVVLVMVASVAATSWLLDDDRSGPPSQQPVAAVGLSVNQQLEMAQSLESRGNFAAAAEVYRSAADARPEPAIRLRLAFALLRAEQPASALAVAQSVEAVQSADPDTLLILGLAQRAMGMGESDATLARFLDVAPEHPAAAEVRELLAY